MALEAGARVLDESLSADRVDSVGWRLPDALGSASQIALFVAPVLVLASYVIGPSPMTLQFWPGAVTMMLIATLVGSLVTMPADRHGSSGRFS